MERFTFLGAAQGPAGFVFCNVPGTLWERSVSAQAPGADPRWHWSPTPHKCETYFSGRSTLASSSASDTQTDSKEPLGEDSFASQELPTFPPQGC